MNVVNNRVALWVREVRAGGGPRLLLLHELGGSSADFCDEEIEWSGSVHALDFSGHGRSGRVVGGGYSPELMCSDADAVLARLEGAVFIIGSGLGAYVGLLLAGARPNLVSGVAFLQGAGLEGGGPEVDIIAGGYAAGRPVALQPQEGGAGLQDVAHTDRMAVARLNADIRPPEYAARFAASASLVALIYGGGPVPPWWSAVARTPGVATREGGLDVALRSLRPG